MALWGWFVIKPKQITPEEKWRKIVCGSYDKRICNISKTSLALLLEHLPLHWVWVDIEGSSILGIIAVPVYFALKDGISANDSTLFGNTHFFLA